MSTKKSCIAKYRARKYGLQNIVKQDPGSTVPGNTGKAGTNFTKPRTSLISVLYTILPSPPELSYLKCNSAHLNAHNSNDFTPFFLYTFYIGFKGFDLISAHNYTEPENMACTACT